MPQQPQAPQATPQGRKRIMKIDGTIVDEFGTVIESGQTLSPMLGNPSGQDTTLSHEAERDLAAGLMTGIGAAAPFFIPGASLPMAAARTLAGAVPSAAGDMIQGEDPVDSSLTEMAKGGIGETLSLALSKASPYLGLASGLVFKDIGRYGRAFNRDAATRGLPIRPGAKPERLQRAIDTASGNLQKAEEAAPGRFPLGQVLEDSQKEYLGRAGTSELPNSLRINVSNANDKMLLEHALERSPLFQGLAPEQRMQVFTKMSPQMQQKILDSTTLSVRELNEVSRGIRTSDAQKLLQSRKDGVHVPTDQATDAQRKINIGSQVRKVTDSVDDGSIKAARDKFGDLKTMQEANNRIRGGLGAATIRGAAGGTTIGSLGRLMGMPGGMTAGTLLAIMFPKLASGSADFASLASRLAPSIFRGGEAYNDISGQTAEERKKTKLRKP